MKKYKWPIIGLFLLLSYGWLSWQARPDGLLHVYFLNVGQGDAIFLRTPSGKNILVDGGPGKTVIEELGDVLPFLNNKLDLVFLTHPDRDHIEGLLSALRRYRVKRVVANGIFKKDFLSEKFISLIEEKNIPFIAADDDADISWNDGVTLDILYPFAPTFHPIEKANNESTIIKVIFGTHEILLTGDIEKETEETLLRRKVNVDSDILKVAHHGSKTSSAENFLKSVTPDFSVISVGKSNRYGHPHPAVLQRLEQLGGKILRTDRQGRIEFIFSKEKIEELKIEKT